jgi:hypothetical protein
VDYEFASIRLSVSQNDEVATSPIVKFADTGLEARSYLTETGLLFAAISDDAPAFEDYFPDLLPLLKRVDFTKLPHRRSLKYLGKFNWKTMVDGCELHDVLCQIATFGIPSRCPILTFRGLRSRMLALPVHTS